MGSSGIIDTSKNTTEVCLTAHLSLFEDKSMFMGDSHEFVMFVMFLFILSMKNYIICNAYHSTTVGEDLVHHPLEDVFAQARPQGR